MHLICVHVRPEVRRPAVNYAYVLLSPLGCFAALKRVQCGFATCTHIGLHTSTHARTRTYTHAQVHTHEPDRSAHTSLHSYCTQVSRRANHFDRLHAHIHAHTRTRTHARSHTRTHVHVHTHARAQTHARTGFLKNAFSRAHINFQRFCQPEGLPTSRHVQNTARCTHSLRHLSHTLHLSLTA